MTTGASTVRATTTLQTFAETDCLVDQSGPRETAAQKRFSLLMLPAIILGVGMEAVFAAPSLPPVPVPPETPDQEGVGLGVAVVSRWPVVASRHYALPSTHRSFEPVVLMVTLDHPAGPLHVFTTVTEWEPSFADDHLAQTRRLAELVSDPALEGPLPVLLAADPNAAPDAPELRPLLAVMTDTWTVGGGDPHARTLRSEHPFAPSEATSNSTNGSTTYWHAAPAMTLWGNASLDPWPAG